MPKPLLQLALDTFDLPSALAPLQRAAPHIDIIEVGTILCLSEGMGAVRVIRSLFPDKTILADVRIAEAGGIIAKMAFRSRRGLGERGQWRGALNRGGRLRCGAATRRRCAN